MNTKKNYKDLLFKILDIGIALTAERDINKLLQKMLLELRKITNSESGSLYIIETLTEDVSKLNGKAANKNFKKILKFKVAQNDIIKLNFKEISLPLNKNSIAGYVGLTGKILNIKDTYKIKNKPYKFDKSFDIKNNYRTCSMLVVPMKNHKDEIIGVIQLINKISKNQSSIKKNKCREKYCVFNKEDLEILSSLASQAAVILENALLYNEVEDLLNSILDSIVTTIDERDRTTAGHSQRVTKYFLLFAQTINKEKKGKFKDIYFNEDDLKELYFAAMLHDVGKIGVKETVLNKKNKLPWLNDEIIQLRLEKIILELKLQSAENGNTKYYKKLIKELEDAKVFIRSLNTKFKTTEDDINRLNKIADKKIIINNRTFKILTPEEKENLSIRFGNLNKKERLEIESHALKTFHILTKIKWPKELINVSPIAAGHHEAINGSGYPFKLRNNDIPLGAKMLAVVDIYEALTAYDRPYKPPLPQKVAFQILKDKAKAGHIDKGLVNLWIKVAKKHPLFEKHRK